ncbi:MAG: hypothetical protein A2086_01105 [Spirochaetes bacterium GWD1_27_9]|nr:MAG: hypothetical protein A2Z98_16035 [Spirochaetes bacterium GWB1_27_13]OHD33650.1 MAG: hypothetical protein A2086_01105 [Spirochaetes bacterium GWD1_27_9]
MITDNISISTKNIHIEQKKKNLSVHGKSNLSENEIFFDVEYKNIAKNFLILFKMNSKMENSYNEIKFYFRFVDDNNYCYFSIKGGQYIKFAIIGDGKPKIQTSYLKITNQNLFSDKYSFILSVFEETTTAIIDETIILNIDHTPEVEGKVGVSFISAKEEEFDIIMENFTITEEIVNFEPIIEMPKKNDVYFMQANDFYEQNRYDLALIYYKRGLLFGRGDDKINNRVGNLLFLIEEYKDAEQYYRMALSQIKDKMEYKVNLGRTLLKLNKDKEAALLLEEAIESGFTDVELFTDYASMWIKMGNYGEALIYLENAAKISPDDFAVLSRMGRCLVELGDIWEGKKYLLKAAQVIKNQDPASAAIILKYSIERRVDLDSLKLLCKLLEDNGEYRDIYELIKKSQWEVEPDIELLNILINAEIKIGLYSYALDEFKKYGEDKMTPKIRLLKTKVLALTDNIKEANTEIDHLLEKAGLVDVSINELVAMKLMILSELGDLKDVEKIFDLSQKNKPHFESVLEEYGKILVDLGKFDEALAIFDKIKDKPKENIELVYNIGLAYIGIEEYAKAKDILLQAYKKQKNPQIIFSLANCMFFTRDYSDALSLLNNYYDILPRDGSTDNLIGNANLSLNRVAEAQKYYYKALDIDKENEEYALNLAESFYKIRDYENAYYITRQIVKKNCVDRAKSLHLRIRSHLFVTLSCSSCMTEWNIPNKEKEHNFPEEKFIDLPNNAPAGFCPKCKKIYCKSCVKGIPNIDAMCPTCNSILSYDSSSLKIIATRILRGEND